MARMESNMLRAVLIALSLACVFCACKEKEIRHPAPAQMPDWCNLSSGFINDAERGRLMIGIGKVEGIKSVEMARANVDGQARKEVAGLYRIYVEKLLDAYGDYEDSGGKKTEKEELKVASAAFAKMNFRATAVEDRYVDEAVMVWYAKAVSSFEAFGSSVQRNVELSERLRRFVAEKENQVFDELSGESGGE